MTYFKLAVFGLIKAIDNFDITQDVQFSTYRSSDDGALVEIIHIKSETIDRSEFCSLLFLRYICLKIK